MKRSIFCFVTLSSVSLCSYRTASFLTQSLAFTRLWNSARRPLAAFFSASPSSSSPNAESNQSISTTTTTTTNQSKTIIESNPSTSSFSNQRRRHRILGISGGIGSGKSLACQILVSELGCMAHIDTDSLAHSVYAPGSDALQEIRSEFGTEVVNESGQVNRTTLGRIVFGDPEAMDTLEQIVWPHVKSALISRIHNITQTSLPLSNNNNAAPIIVVEAAVLLDAGWDDLLDALWIIRASQTLTTQRLFQNRNMTQIDANLRIQAQNHRRGIGNLEEEVRRGAVTAVIENDGSEGRLKEVLELMLLKKEAWKEGRDPLTIE